MVSGSQLQVAKLAQMCPAAPSSAQWRPAVASGNPGQNPSQAPGSSSRVKLPGQAPGSSSLSRTRQPDSLYMAWAIALVICTDSF